MVHQVRTQKGNNYMEQSVNVEVTSQDITSQLLAKYRATAKPYGRYFGEQIFTIIATNPDLKWKEDVAMDKNVLRKEVNVLVVKPIDISGVEFLPKDFDGNPKIVLNPKLNDPTLVFDLVPPEFKKATRENVADCIDRIGKKNSKPIFFSAEELPALNSYLRIHNQSVLSFYEEQSRKFMKLSETVRGIMDQADRLQSDYLRQCGVDTSETEVTVKVTLEETN